MSLWQCSAPILKKQNHNYKQHSLIEDTNMLPKDYNRKHNMISVTPTLLMKQKHWYPTSVGITRKIQNKCTLEWEKQEEEKAMVEEKQKQGNKAILDYSNNSNFMDE